MSQNDLSIANQGFASFRSDLNSALQALASTNSGTSAPSTTYANQLFYDTSNNILKIRNEDNDAFISLFTLDQTNDLISGFTSPITITTADNNPQLTLISTDADASVGPVMILKRDSSSPADDDALGFLKFDGENSASEQTTYASINARSADVTDSTEDGKLDIFTIQNGASVNRQSFNTTETVFNEDSKDIDFRVESDGNANMLVVDAGLNAVSIGGGASTSYQLKVARSDGSAQQLISAGTNFNSTIAFGDQDLNDAGEIIYAHNGNSMRFHTNDAERMRIDSSGNVGIGTTSMTTGLELHGATANACTFKLRDTGDYSSGTGPVIAFQGKDSSESFTNFAQISGVSVSSDNGMLKFETRNSGAIAERVRIQSDGDVLIGKTTDSITTAGIAMSNTLGIRPVVDGDVAMLANRLTSEGELIQLRKDSAKKGAIGIKDGQPFISNAGGTNNCGIRLASNAIVPTSSDGSVSDNGEDLGASDARFDDIHATNGTIQTSDKNEKQDIEELNDAEKKVAVVAKGLMRKFRWKDKVAEKGDKARTHFGIIAQDLEDAFKAEGLDASKYAMFCSDTWTNDDGKEQTRLGIRYPQLLAFIISAI